MENKLLVDEDEQALLRMAIDNPDSELGKSMHKKCSKCIKCSARHATPDRNALRCPAPTGAHRCCRWSVARRRSTGSC